MDKPLDAPLTTTTELAIAPPLPEVPSWMLPATPLAKLRLDNELTTFENALDGLLEHVAAGNPLSAAVERDPRDISYSRLLAWIHRDPARVERYRQAQEIGAEVVADQMIEIADGEGLEDVNRSTLRINTRKWLLGVWNRKRYGEVKQIEQNVNIDLGEAMAAAQARALTFRNADVVDTVAREIR